MLKKDLNEKDLKLSEEYEANRTRLEQENRILNEKLQTLTAEYQEKMTYLQSQQNQEIQTLLNNLAKENEVHIERYSIILFS